LEIDWNFLFISFLFLEIEISETVEDLIRQFTVIRPSTKVKSVCFMESDGGKKPTLKVHLLFPNI